MIAESGYFDPILLGSLEDGEVIIDLVWLIIDEDLDLLGGESSERAKATLQFWEFGEHYNKYHSIFHTPQLIKQKQVENRVSTIKFVIP